MQKLHNVAELADYIGAHEPTEDSMSRRVYKDTACGAWLAFAYAPRFTLRFPWPRHWAPWPRPIVRVIEALHLLEPLDYLLFVARKDLGRRIVGVDLGSIVEGSDYCAGPYGLRFPITPEQYGNVIRSIEDECDEAWHAANDDDDDEDDDDIACAREEPGESPEDEAIDALCEAMDFLRLLRDVAQYDSASEQYRVNGRTVDYRHLARLIAHIETALSGMYPVT